MARIRIPGGVPLLCSVLFLILSACQPGGTTTPQAVASATLTASPTASPSVTSTATSTPEPPWYQPLDESYGHMEYRYGLVVDPDARIYASLEDALNQTGNFDTMHVVPGYVSIVREDERDGKTFYVVNYGWMETEDVQEATPSSLRGILLSRPVDFRFGWLLAEAQSVNAAGDPIRWYARHELVHEVPALTEKPGYLAVGPDEWLPEELVAVTDARLPEDAGEGTCRFIHVDLKEQTLRVFDQCQLVFATLVSSGREAAWTYPGRFAILQKFPYIQLTPPAGSLSVYYLEAVPDFMTYAGDLGFHGAYWHDDFGTPVSHGCINLAPADARWLYQWAWLGERVIISAGD